MVLEDILAFISDNTDVYIISAESGKVISRYDGKDSIDKRLNNRKVVDISGTNQAFRIDITVVV